MMMNRLDGVGCGVWYNGTTGAGTDVRMGRKNHGRRLSPS
jgi:hypothetical protein